MSDKGLRENASFSNAYGKAYYLKDFLGYLPNALRGDGQNLRKYVEVSS